MILDLVVGNINEGVKLGTVKNKLKRVQDEAVGDTMFMLTAVDKGNERSAYADCFNELVECLELPTNHFIHEFDELPTGLPGGYRWAGKGGGSQGNSIHTTLEDIDYTELDIPHTTRMQRDSSTIIPEMIEPRKGNHRGQRISLSHNKIPYTFTHGHLAFWKSSEEERDTQFDAMCAGLSQEELLHAFVGGDLNSFGRLTGLRNKRVYQALGCLDPDARHRMIHAWRNFGLLDPNIQQGNESLHTIEKFFGLIRAKTDWGFFGRDIYKKVTQHEVLHETGSDHAFLKYTVDLG